jgi:hypothetical protein
LAIPTIIQEPSNARPHRPPGHQRLVSRLGLWLDGETTLEQARAILAENVSISTPGVSGIVAARMVVLSGRWWKASSAGGELAIDAWLSAVRSDLHTFCGSPPSEDGRRDRIGMWLRLN